MPHQEVRKKPNRTMNKYELTHVAKCPNNNQKDVYNITIESEETIMVEDINEFFHENRIAKMYQEQWADALAERFPDAKICFACEHQGIMITTERGKE